MDTAAIDRLVGEVLASLGRREPIPPAALTLLLRRYTVTGDEALSEAAGPALAAALDGATSSERSREQAAWLRLFVEAAAISDDDRLPHTTAALVSLLRGSWPARGELEPAFQAIDACLAAAGAFPDLFSPRGLLQAAIDELERVVRLAYRPGEGLAHSVQEPDGLRGTLADHVAAASALLTAYAITGRLPYSMLAEELMQFVRRTNPDEGASDLVRFVARAEAARVLCRLAKLHEDADYRQVAVIAVSSDYATDARRALADLAGIEARYGVDAAVFGLALGELDALR